MKVRAVAVAFLLTLAVSVPAQAGDGGFDQYGYNYTARVFVGAADGVDRSFDGTVWGDATYANDHLVMKWNAEWDRGNDTEWADPAGYKGAWTDNEWNGKCDGCSGQVWHYKILWIGTCSDGATLPDGGYCIWGQFEVVMDQGFDPNVGAGHIWFAHATPNGYGRPLP